MAKIIEIEKLSKQMQKDIKRIQDIEKSKYEMITLDEHKKMRQNMSNNDNNWTFVAQTVLELEEKEEELKEIEQLNNDIFKEKDNERKM